MQAVPRSRVHFREGAWANVLVVMMGVVMWLVFRHTAPAHDVAWLMEGARRWLEGARLYDDIRELNPPLIFYDMVGLSAGTTSNVVFVAGVAATSVITSLWVGRYHGVLLSVGTSEPFRILGEGPAQPAQLPGALLSRSGSDRLAAFALALGAGLELAAGGVDVAAARGAHRG